MGVSPSHWLIMPDNPPPDMSKVVVMGDHFPKIQKLPDPVNGCPNFRRIPGYKVYCCGQPTIAGFKAALEKVCGTIYPKDGKIIWLNMRQEPNVYVNGVPISARPPNKIGEYAKLVDIEKTEKALQVMELKTLSEVIEGVKADFPGLVHMRIPTCNSAAPPESDFDKICQVLVGTSINTPIVINDMVGLTRCTTASVIACLFKEFQINASFEGLVETVPGVNLDLLKMDKYTMDPKKDPLFRGEFEVVRQLLEKLKDGKGAKNECDKVIDKNGTAKTGGTGIKHLRENIAESKLSYEIMDDSAQAFLKVKIMDNIHKYYYMIAFTAYMREAADLARNAVSEEQKAALTLTSGKCAIPGNQLKLTKTFTAFMEEKKELREMIVEGKGNLQWERDIPPASLKNLEDLAKGDFKANLGKIIHDIYQTAHTMFSDMPQGDHKKRAKYRFASKTLMRILPAPFKGEVEELIEKKAICLDLYEILGKCTWGQKAAEK